MTEVVLPQRIQSKFKEADNGCWVWTAALSSTGYGRVRWEGKVWQAHRLTYSLTAGEPGPELDHLCRNRACVNPAHMEPVSHAENIRRGEWSEGARRARMRRTECANGHPYTAETLYVPPPSSRAQRQCRICRSEAKKRNRAKGKTR